MTRWSLIKRDGLYVWSGASCWGGGEEHGGGWRTKDEALNNKPLGAGRYDDKTGDPVPVTPQRWSENLERAARDVLSSVISWSSGPAAPIFDAADAEVENNRGTWAAVDGEAINALRRALETPAEISQEADSPEVRLIRAVRGFAAALTMPEHVWDRSDLSVAEVGRRLTSLLDDPTYDYRR